jgi:hypothetical protein
MVDTPFLRSDALPGRAALGYLAVDDLRTNILRLPYVSSGRSELALPGGRGRAQRRRTS